LIFFAQTLPASIFGFAVGFFPFISATILFLSSAFNFLFCDYPAGITAVSLSPEARPADIENQTAPSTANFDQ
jgi:hypothetical protein